MKLVRQTTLPQARQSTLSQARQSTLSHKYKTGKTEKSATQVQDWTDRALCYTNTGCPKTKLALGKHLNIATHGFKMCILYLKKDKLCHNP